MIQYRIWKHNDAKLLKIVQYHIGNIIIMYVNKLYIHSIAYMYSKHVCIYKLLLEIRKKILLLNSDSIYQNICFVI